MLCSYYIDSFIEFAEDYPHNKLLLLEYDNDFDIMDTISFIPTNSPSSKELRLALDLIDELYPLFGVLPITDKVDALKEVFKMNTTVDRLQRLHSHKEIVFKSVITIKNNKIKFIRVLKK